MRGDKKVLISCLGIYFCYVKR